MKTLKLISVLAVLLTACDSTYEDLHKINRDPRITFTYLSNELTSTLDSVKNSSRLKTPYDQYFTVEDDDNNLVEVYYKVRSGTGNVFSNGNYTNRTLSKNSNGIYHLQYRPKGLGYHQIEVYALDQLNGETKVTIDLISFDNIKPVARLDVTPKRLLGKYEYRINGSESFDVDGIYGGAIELYQFNINSQVIELRQPELSYVFGGEDIYSIGLRVMDNDGVWSERTEQLYSID